MLSKRELVRRPLPDQLGEDATAGSHTANKNKTQMRYLVAADPNQLNFYFFMAWQPSGFQHVSMSNIIKHVSTFTVFHISTIKTMT